MNTTDIRKYAGVGSMLIRDGKILLVFRSHTDKNNNRYGLVGGHVEANESVLQAAIREIKEEVGVDVHPADMKLVHCMSSRENGEETLGFYFIVSKWRGEPINNQPEKHSRIEWCPLDQLPQNLIERNRQAIQMMQQNIPYSEYGWK